MKFFVKVSLWLLTAPIVLGQTISYHPLIVDGVGLETFVSLTNHGAANQTTIIELFDDAGSPMELTWGVLSNCGVGCLSVDLAPGASFDGQTGNGAILKVGYARITSVSDVEVLISNDFLGNSVNFSQYMPVFNETVPIDDDTVNSTAVIVINTGTVTSNLSITLKDSGQNVVANKALTPGPGTRFAYFFSEIFPSMPAVFVGTGEFQSDQPMIIAGLRLDGSGGIYPVPENPTPEEVLEGMILQVQALVPNELTQDQADGLTDKLEAVIEALEAGALRDACNRLGAFENQVAAFARNGKLSEATAQALTAEALAVGTELGC